MNSISSDAARMFSPSVRRNRDVLLAVLTARFRGCERVLEIGSGSGEHAVFFAQALENITWMPTDPDPQARASIAAWTAATEVDNVEPPVALDVEVLPWSLAAPTVDAVIAINVIHITPPSTTTGLLEGAAQVLGSGGSLILYGPFRRNGEHTAPSNAEFDQWLKNRDPAFGVRDLEQVAAEARTFGLELAEVVEMPANNLTVFFSADRRVLRSHPRSKPATENPAPRSSAAGTPR